MATPATPNEQTRRKAPAKWTVMIYMAAGDGADLDAHAVADLREMERAAVGPDVNVVVQMNRFWPARPQRYQILQGETRLVRPDIVKDEPIRDADASTKNLATAEKAGMSDQATLSNFLLWARENHPADHYFLVLWGHAYGLGFGRDHGEPLTLPEIRDAIADFRRPLGADGKPDAAAPPSGPQLDLLGANACAVGYAEAVCELAEHVRYLVASEIAVPFAGWPYEAILGCLSRGPRAAVPWQADAVALGTLVVDRYVGQFNGSPGGERVAMALLRLARANDLRKAVASLANAIAAVIDGTDKGAGERRAMIRAAFLSAAAGDVRPLLDLHDLAERIGAVCEDLETLDTGTNKEVRAAIAKVRTEAADVVAFVEPVGSTDGDPLVACRNQHPDLTDLRGVGIFAPFVTDERDLKRLGLDAATPQTGRAGYMKLKLSSESDWPTLVFDTLRAPLPADIVATIEGSGAGNRADRLGVAQILTSIDALFDTFDRRVAATRSVAIKNLPGSATAGPAAAIGTEALSMLGRLQLLRHAEIDRMFEQAGETRTLSRTAGSGTSGLSSGGTPAVGAASAGTSDQAVAMSTHFMRLEAAMADVERAVRRTLTNGTFGLGPGLGMPDKDGLGMRDKDGLGMPDKDGLGMRDKDGLGMRDKDGLGMRDKDGLGMRDKDGLGATGAGAAQPSPTAVVADLFRQVAVALGRLETAAADVETIGAKALLAPVGVHGFEPLSNVTLANARLERAFRALAEASVDLRRTVRRVVAHPTYGIGPGPASVNVDDRRELARLAGLSSVDLQLL